MSSHLDVGIRCHLLYRCRFNVICIDKWVLNVILFIDGI